MNRMNTGNIAGGLNASYPNIPLNVGSNTQLATGTNGVDYIATSPPQGWYEGGGSAYTVIPKSEVISLYGITADKIVKGKTVAGVTGTGETGYSSCSSCCASLASQTSSATAGAGDILSGKTAYVNGSKITGTMANKGAVTGTVSPGGTYTIPAGYHNGSGKVTASSCPTCPGRDGPSSFTDVTYSTNMTLEAGSYYLIDGSAWSTVNGTTPSLSF